MRENKIGAERMELIFKLLKSSKSYTSNQIVNFLLENYDIKISQRTIQRDIDHIMRTHDVDILYDRKTRTYCYYNPDTITRKRILDFINEKVFKPNLENPRVSKDIKESIIDTRERINEMESLEHVMVFFNYALKARRGGQIENEFHKYGLISFEDIKDEVRAMAEGKM